MSDQRLNCKIAHLQMIQGVIGRMAADIQNLKTLAITITAAIIALAQTTVITAPWLTLLGVPITGLFWWLTAYHLHVERSYRRLYDAVRTDEPVESFTMDWRLYENQVDKPKILAFSQSIAWPYGGIVVILVVVSIAAAWGGVVEQEEVEDGRAFSRQVK